MNSSRNNIKSKSYSSCDSPPSFAGSSSDQDSTNSAHKQFVRRRKEFVDRGISPLVRPKSADYGATTTIDGSSKKLVKQKIPLPEIAEADASSIDQEYSNFDTFESDHDVFDLDNHENDFKNHMPLLESTPDFCMNNEFTSTRSKTPMNMSGIQENTNSTNFDVQNRGAAYVSTPISRFTSNIGSISMKTCTPTANCTTNPFESYCLDRLNTNTFSPSTFAKVVSPSDESHDENGFRWSIDHIAVLHPAEIEIEHPSQVASARMDSETEARYQAMVDKYFAEGVIAPSPWSEPNEGPKHHFFDDSKNSNAELFQRLENRNRSCQTMLTFPPNVDLMQIFGACFIYKEYEDVLTTSEANLSANTLRRKLFDDANNENS